VGWREGWVAVYCWGAWGEGWGACGGGEGVYGEGGEVGGAYMIVMTIFWLCKCQRLY